MPRFIPPGKRLIVSPFPFNRSPGLSVIYYGMIGMFRPGMRLIDAKISEAMEQLRNDIQDATGIRP